MSSIRTLVPPLAGSNEGIISSIGTDGIGAIDNSRLEGAVVMKESITKLMETLPDTEAESIEQMTVSGDTSRPGTTTWEPNRQNGPDDVEPALKRSPITVTMLLPFEAICVGWKLTTVGTGSYVKDTPEDIDTLSPTVTSRLAAHVSIGTSGLIGLMHSSDDDVRKRAGGRLRAVEATARRFIPVKPLAKYRE